MTQSYIKPWEWFHGFGTLAIKVKDEARIQLYQIHSKASREAQRDPQQALDLYRDGARRAADLKEPWMQLFYEWWIASTTIAGLHRYEEGLDLSIKLVTKASQDLYYDFPFRAQIFLNLIMAYFRLDKLSYLKEMEAMIETVSKMPLDRDSHARILVFRAQFWHFLGNPDKAIETTIELIEMSEGNYFRLASSYESLSFFCYLQQKDQKAFEYAHLALENTLKAKQLSTLSRIYWWLAALTFLRGDPQEAERLFQLGFIEVKQLVNPKDPLLWEAACRYYELIGDYDKALIYWDKQVAAMDPQTINRQSYFSIFLRRCYVLRAMKRLTRLDIEQAHEIALSLRKPEEYLARLERLLDGRTQIPRH